MPRQKCSKKKIVDISIVISSSKKKKKEKKEKKKGIKKLILRSKGNPLASLYSLFFLIQTFPRDSNPSFLPSFLFPTRPLVSRNKPATPRNSASSPDAIFPVEEVGQKGLPTRKIREDPANFPCLLPGKQAPCRQKVAKLNNSKGTT